MKVHYKDIKREFEIEMPQDVSKDPRILMVEAVLKILKDLTLQKKYKLPGSKEKTMEAINRVNSSIKQIKYSYISPLDLVEDRMIKEFDLMANQFWDAILKNVQEIKKNRFIMAKLQFIFNVLRGFKSRLMLGNEGSIEKAVDIIAVKILSISDLEKKENLKICRVGDGERALNIITNLTGIKKDMVLPAAILPPREFGLQVSEAMFCSNEDLVAMREQVGERVTLPANALKEVNHYVLDLLKDT